ncbi:glycosyl hydrolase family 3 C-terminal domain protein [Mycobacterium xenopi 4042]|uniref:Glycosyl hydrolase family 3 C-terminal domain protein n=1 Tax=Mycobacterium xenopi 4042 TaxID=1299334 RepID=X8BLL3_MYCXE|nr:glycosyl hydrolase family 3 C-terminal domain protein [Mycobacterium xenopi 4042]
MVFAVRVEGEGFDNADLALPWGQDAVIEAVAEAQPNTVVVLETGNPTAMPWREKVNAILQAWYPGQAGGQAIAEILVGAANPCGRLPLTFPLDLSQTPRRSCLAWAPRGGHRSPFTTAKGPRSGTGGTRRRAIARCSRSVMACPTPGLSAAT